MLGLFAGCEEEPSAYIPTGDALSTDAPVSDDANTGEKAQVALAYYPDRSLNPLNCTDYTNRTLFSLIYQGLFAVNSDYECSPILCKSYNVSADLKTYTFYLENALFSDGTPLTAADVVATLKASQSSSWYSGRLQHVQSISSYGEAVVIELSTPMENLPILLDIPILKATEVDAQTPLGTGPYRLVGDQLRRQAGWWCDAELSISWDTIPLVQADSPAAIRDAFEFGAVSLVCANPADRDNVSFHSDYELWECENGLFLYLVCNIKSEVFSNDDLRAALTHAIDRDSLVETYYHGFARAASLPASAQSPYYNNALAARYAYDPLQFREAVDAAAPSTMELTLLLNADDPLRLKVGQSIAAMLAEYGFTVTITEATGETFTKLLKKGEYDLYLAQTHLSANMDLSAFFGTDTALSYGGLTNASLYAIAQGALANAGNYYSLHEKIMEYGQLCPILFQSYAIYGRRGAQSDITPARDAVFYYDLGKTMADALNGV